MLDDALYCRLLTTHKCQAPKGRPWNPLTLPQELAGVRNGGDGGIGGPSVRIPDMAQDGLFNPLCSVYELCGKGSGRGRGQGGGGGVHSGTEPLQKRFAVAQRHRVVASLFAVLCPVFRHESELRYPRDASAVARPKTLIVNSMH